MGQRVASLFAILVLMVAPALAGDRAGMNIIGYSADARYFAFAQFGIQDGSGFAYADVQILDLDTDKWVSGTPIRMRTEDENQDLGSVLADAMAKAAPLLDRYDIAQPAEILALNGDGVPTEDYDRLAFGLPGYGMMEPDGSGLLTLETFAAQGDPACATYQDDPIVGFALTLTENGVARNVHHDAKVPASRGCTTAYRLYGVVSPFDSFASFNTEAPFAASVALVSVYSLGFEGPDRRFVAVPLGN